jgi:hypothetical protein
MPSLNQALKNGVLSVRLNTKKTEFLNAQLSFFDIVSYRISRANRASLGTNKAFMALILKEQDVPVGLGQNAFILKIGTETIIPPFVLSSANYGNLVSSRVTTPTPADTTLPEELQSGYIDYEPTADEKKEVAFGKSDLFPMPYIPFVSNCKFYGSIVYLQSVFESHPDCVLVKEADVVPISNLNFGMSPKSDSCVNVTLSCR